MTLTILADASFSCVWRLVACGGSGRACWSFLRARSLLPQHSLLSSLPPSLSPALNVGVDFPFPPPPSLLQPCPIWTDRSNSCDDARPSKSAAVEEREK